MFLDFIKGCFQKELNKRIRMRTLLFLLVLVGSGHQQDGIEIKKRSDYITVKRDPNSGNHEIYTSMQVNQDI